MKVSVLTTTYNQEKYIAQAIDSILMQEVDFDYEIVIGEDASTDRTREIVLEYAEKHPDKIRLLLRGAATAERDRARGLGGKTNFVNSLRSCRGEFVALLDGDDYWTSPHKLQKQADYLDGHPDVTLCFHNGVAINEGASAVRGNFVRAGQKEISTLEDIVMFNFVYPCTAMFRNGLWKDLPEAFSKTLSGDWMLFILCAEHGKIGFINEVMAVYRVNVGVWSKRPFVEQLKGVIASHEIIDEHLKFKYHPIISKQISSIRKMLPEEYRKHARTRLDEYHALAQRGETTKGLRFLLEAIHASPSEIFRLRRLLAVLKNGFLGILHKKRTQN